MQKQHLMIKNLQQLSYSHYIMKTQIEQWITLNHPSHPYYHLQIEPFSSYYPSLLTDLPCAKVKLDKLKEKEIFKKNNKTKT